MRHRIVIVNICLLICAMFIFGCGNGIREYSSTEIVSVLKKKLNEKYGLTYEVKNVEEKHYVQNFTYYYYSATVIENEHPADEFHVTIGKKGSDMRDDYERILYGGVIEEWIKEAFVDTNDLQIEDEKIHYDLRSEKSESVEEYARSDGVDYTASIRLNCTSMGEAVDQVNKMTQVLQDHEIRFLLTVNTDKGDFSLGYNPSVAKKNSRQDILDKYLDTIDYTK